MNMSDVYAKRNSFFLTPSPLISGLSWVFLAVGILGIGYGVSDGEITAKHIWGAILFNLFFFFSLGLGGMGFAAIQDVIGANWARPIKRIMESFSRFLFVALGIFLVFLFCAAFDLLGAGSVYSWIKDPAVVEHFYGKNIWLQKNFWLVRNIFIVIAIGLAARWQLSMVLPRDHELITGDKAKAEAMAHESKFKLKLWSSLVLLVYGVGLTFFGMDLIMSLSPLWFSTLFGGWQLAVAFQSLMAVLLIIMFMFKGTDIGSVIGQQQFHDVGKLMYGFSCFFAYLTFAHILTYWYGNVPEETEYFLHRLHEPYLSMVVYIPFVSFVIPLYLFMFKAAKWTGAIAIPMALIVLSGLWLANLVLVMPEVSTPEQFGSGILEFAVFLGFLGLFARCVFWFGKDHPMVGVADPLLADALRGGH